MSDATEPPDATEAEPGPDDDRDRPVDPMAPGASIDDEDAPEAVEPNEPA